MWRPTKIVCMKLSSEMEFLWFCDSFLWEEYKCERIVAFGKVKQADDIHFTNDTVVFFVCRVYVMVAIVRVSSGVVFSRKGIV
jgi:hypothetical protein